MLRRFAHSLALSQGTVVAAAAAASLKSSAASISSLVWVEHKDGKVSPATLSTVTAASRLGGPVTAVVAGKNVGAAAEAVAQVEGVQKVLTADAEALAAPVAEPLAACLAALLQQGSGGWTHALAAATTYGKNFFPRAAALLGVQPVSDAIEVVDADTFARPTYAGNAIATVKYIVPGLRMLTVRPTAFPPAAATGSTAASIEAVPTEALAAAQDPGCPVPVWGGVQGAVSERPELASAKVVVSGGRALKSAENFKALERLADLLGGAVGASRAAVDAGFVPNDMQVGQTGKVVAPELYLALGISGAIQHVAGMKDSKVIVAINTDPEAPIFQLADYGLVQDLFTALPELEAEIAKAKGKA